MELKKILEKRRSIYNIGNDLPISEDEVTTLVKDLTELVPDAFDMKSARVIILFNEKHHFFWDTVFNIFDGKISREKIESFKSGLELYCIFMIKT